MNELNHDYINEYTAEVERMASCLQEYDIDINPDLYDPVHDGCFESPEAFMKNAGLMAAANSEEKMVEYMETVYDELVVGRLGIEGPIGKAHTDIALDYKVTVEDGDVSRYWELNPGIANINEKVTEEQLRNIEAAVRECTDSVESFKQIENMSDMLTSLALGD